MTPPGPDGSFAGLLEVIIARAGGVTELARATKVSPGTLTRWRRGDHPSSRISGGVEAVNLWARNNVPGYPPPGYHPSGLLGYVGTPEIPTGLAATRAEEPSLGLNPPADSTPPAPPSPAATGTSRDKKVIAVLTFLAVVAGIVVAIVLLHEPSSPSRTVTVQNKFATGTSDLLEDRSPSYLSSVTRGRCAEQGCKIAGTEMRSGAQLTATCRTLGDTLTNADKTSPGIAVNPGAATSDVWIYASDPSGAQGFISVVYLAPSDRQPDELPLC